MCPPQSSVPMKVTPETSFLRRFGCTMELPPGLAPPKGTSSPQPGQTSFLASPPPGLSRIVRDVWNWNFEQEFSSLLTIAANCTFATIATSIRFPCRFPKMSAQYDALRRDLCEVAPVQLGIAVADVNGSLQGTWNFNLLFDKTNDMRAETSGKVPCLDFQQLATEGVNPQVLAHRIASSTLVGAHTESPLWISCGSYDVGYLLKAMSNDSLPMEFTIFQASLAKFFPNCVGLAELFPLLNLDSVVRFDASHDASQNALVALELYFDLSHMELLRTGPCTAERKQLEPSRVWVDEEVAKTCTIEHGSAREFTTQRVSQSIWSLKARRVRPPVIIDEDAPTSLWAAAAKQVATEAISSSVFKHASANATGKISAAKCRSKTSGKQAVRWSDIVRGH